MAVMMAKESCIRRICAITLATSKMAMSKVKGFCITKMVKKSMMESLWMVSFRAMENFTIFMGRWFMMESG